MYVYIMYVWMYVCMYVRVYVCTYVCMYICVYVCMYVCMYAYDFEHISPAYALEHKWIIYIVSKQDSVFILHIRYTLTITNVNL